MGALAGRGTGAGVTTGGSIAGALGIFGALGRAGSGALLRLIGNATLGTDAGRAGVLAVAAGDAALTVAGAAMLAEGEAALAVCIGLDSEAVASAGVRLTLLVAVMTGVGAAAVGAGAGPRVAKNAAAPITNALKPTQSIFLEDFLGAVPCLPDLTRSASSGIGFMAVLDFALIAPDAFCAEPGSVMGNCVGANWVLAPYSESL